MGNVIMTNCFGIMYPITTNSFEKLNDFAKNVYEEINKLEKEKIPLLFVCRGSSGSVLTTLVANIFYQNRWEVKIHYVKKEIEKDHGGNSLSIPFSSYKTVVIDDFISTGDTMEHIYKNVFPTINVCDYLLVDRGGEKMKYSEFFKTIITG